MDFANLETSLFFRIWFVYGKYSEIAEPLAELSIYVTPAQAGVQKSLANLDSGFRRNDARGLLQEPQRRNISFSFSRALQNPHISDFCWLQMGRVEDGV
jgi:hypothetical protein